MPKVESGFFFLGLSLLIVWESVRLGVGTLVEPGPGFISCCAGMVLFFLSLSLIYRGWGYRKSQEPYSRRVLAVVVSLFVYSLALNYLGFIVATFILVGVLFQIGEPRRWWVLLTMSALVTFSSYLLFSTLLKVFFPKGLLF